VSRNIVLVTVDSLRADHCGFNGGDPELTPTLDDLAENGLVFENAFAPGPRTPSSMPVLMTGEFPSAQNGEFSWHSRWDRIRKHLGTHRTVAERLRDRGYTTVGVTTNPWTHGTGFDSGFDHFVELTADDMENLSPVFRLLERGMQFGDLADRYSWHNKREWFVRWQNQYANILDAIKIARENEPYFLWLFLLDSHQPYMVSRTHRVDSNVFEMYFGAFQEFWYNSESLPEGTLDRLHRAYRDSVRSTDEFVDRLREDLAADDPLLVFHSDHGEAFDEHGTYGHERELYEENLRVPLLVHGSNQSSRVEDLVPLRALPELLAQLAGNEAIDPAKLTREFIFAATEDTDTWVVRNDRWKYIQNGEREQLFDLDTDEREQENVAEDDPDVAESLRRLVGNVQSASAEKAQIRRAVEETVPVRAAAVEGRS